MAFLGSNFSKQYAQLWIRFNQLRERFNFQLCDDSNTPTVPWQQWPDV